MTWYDAVFDHGRQMRTVGPFDSSDEADEYGRARQSDQVNYLGWAERTGRVEFDRVVGAMQVRADQPDHGWYGVLTRWEPGATQGFITDRDGCSWFVSRDDLPGGLAALEVGVNVWFTGSPHPKPGKKYPQAYTVLITGPEA